MDQQHKTITVDYTKPRWSDDPGADASTTMIEAQFDARPPRTGERWYQCPVCLETYPASEVVWVHGRAYCSDDADDVLIDEEKRKGRAI